MELLKNSVWKVSGVDGLKDGVYRVVEIAPDIDSILLFEIADPKKIKKPISYLLSDFVNHDDSNKIKRADIEVPLYMLQPDEKLPAQYLCMRDNKYNVISGLIKSLVSLFDLAENPKSRVLKKHADMHGVTSLYVRRALNLYWHYGAGENSLLPAYDLSGGRNKSRSSGKKKRGRPVSSINDYFSFSQGVNVDEECKRKIKKGVRKYYLNKKGVTLKKSYEKTLKEFFKEELNKEVFDGEVRVPSYFQFRYWARRLFSDHERMVKKSSESDFLKNKRELLSISTASSPLPGSCFELDATVADVNVVSRFNRRHVLGRPTLYFVVDKCSRMIVGFHVSLKFASWEAGRQALVNSFLPKKQLCARYGVDIEDHEWPCYHLPERLLCDRGEFVCNQPEKLVVPMMQLNIAPPYRADAKGIVERRFGLFNEKLLHDLDGGQKKPIRIRGEEDPRDHAVYTLDEIGALVIHEIIAHNRSKFESLALESSIFIENDMAPKPINYWNYALSTYRHALSSRPNEEIIARLLPATDVTLCRYGIRYGSHLFYSVDTLEFRKMVSTARERGSRKLEARIDKDNSDSIYVRLKDGGSFTKAVLTERSKIFSLTHEEDVQYFSSWRQSQFRGHGLTSEDIDSHEAQKEMSQKAKSDIERHPKLSSKSERYKDMRTRRKEEASQEVLSNSFDVMETEVEKNSGDTSSVMGRDDSEISNVVSMLKRKKKK